MILVVDNYDSFAYNLVQYVAEAVDEAGAAGGTTPDGDGDEEQASADGDEPFDGVVVRRNDEVTVPEVRALDPDGIVVSPGPGTPEEAGISVDLFAETDYPILGVCLGHQALCAANGVPVGHAPEVVHGKPSTVAHDGEGIYEGLPNPFRAGRYHSLAVERGDLPDHLIETARTDAEAGVLMGVRHAEKPHVGVQFHPESILTGPPGGREDGTAASLAVGKRIVRNFLCSTT